MSSNAKNDFSQGKVWACILSQAIPLTVAQMVHVLYNLVDRIYLGHLPGASSLALTGVGLIFPIVSFISAFCSLFGTGGAPLCSIARGAGNHERAERIMGTTFTLLVSTGAVLMVMGYIFRKPILYAFGASDDTYVYADAYLSVYLVGTVFVMIGTGMNGFINAQGFARMGMVTIMLGAILNVILDPLFIFVLNMGVRGAALATVISQFASCVWVLLFLTGKKAILVLKKEHLRPDFKLLKEITALGFSGFIMSGTNCLVQVACNATLRVWGGDTYIGIMTVLNSIRELFGLPVNGLTQGAQPVIGYNYGAKQYGRIRESIRFMSITCITITFVCWLFIVTCPRLLFSLFSSDPALIENGIPALHIYFAGFFLMSLQMSGQSTFVALGKARHAVFFSLLRKAIIVFPLTVLLPHCGLGMDGVFWAEPISNATGAVACFVVMLLTVLPMLRREEKALQNK